jgi:hypothetical protein
MMAWYRGVYAVCIGYLSVRTMLVATAITDHHFWLAGLELIGVVLFLFATTRRAGLVVLLVVYAIAAIHELIVGHVPAALVVYAVSAAALARPDVNPT